MCNKEPFQSLLKTKSNLTSLKFFRPVHSIIETRFCPLLCSNLPYHLHTFVYFDLELNGSVVLLILIDVFVP